jgi:hypothetical protein
VITAKVFWSSNSQAVRSPKEEWPASFWQAFGDMPEDFERPAARTQVREPLEP